MNKELKPCPFEAKHHHAVGVTGPSILLLLYTIRCSTCRFNGPSFATKQGAIDHWNTRTTEGGEG